MFNIVAHHKISKDKGRLLSGGRRLSGVLVEE